MFSPDSRHRQRNDPSSTARVRPLTIDSRIDDLLKHPAFKSFGRLLLPWDDRPHDATLKLKNIGTLLPYHSHVDAGVVVSSLNRLIDDAAAGQTIFYDIYSDAEKRAEPTRADTGLFFLRGKPGAPFAVIAPGGGFSYVASVHEGFPYGVEINKHGYNAFVLKYRVGQGGAVATRDLAAAISYIFQHADALGVSTRGYSAWGSSAGARMAASVGSNGPNRFGGADVPKPSTVVMAYTGHSDVSLDEPPTFVVVGELDRIAPAPAMEARVSLLRKDGANVEFHRYPNVGHGFGLGVGTGAAGWIDEAVRFWTSNLGAPSEDSQS